jgi:hypothetical protein
VRRGGYGTACGRACELERACAGRDLQLQFATGRHHQWPQMGAPLLNMAPFVGSSRVVSSPELFHFIFARTQESGPGLDHSRP